MQITKIAASKVIGKVADVSKSTEVRDLFETVDREFGAPDILVNNAGIGVFKPAAELTVQDWDRTLQTNLSGAFYCSRKPW